MSLECSICEHDVRGGHAVDCPFYTNPTCECGHTQNEHDEESNCQECSCPWFVDIDEETKCQVN